MVRVTNDKGFNDGSVVKNWPANAGDVGLVPGSGSPPRRGNDNPLQYFFLGNPMGRGAWRAIVLEVEKSLSAHTDTHTQMINIIMN